MTTPMAVAPGLPSPLAPLRFPLHGSRLIEASAGTGKTFTIAALYVRLVLGHGGDEAFTRPLTPPEILVVSFTDAATKELRDRIRARLAEAAGYFLQSPDDLAEQPAGADLLHDLRAEYAPEQWPGCARKLQLAAEWMDEAAVSTIHGWCNRMLGEHAFDSGSLFSLSLETDQSELLNEVVRDYWRTFFFALDEEQTKVVHGWWQTPDALYAGIRLLLEHSTELGSAAEPAASIGTSLQQRRTALAALKAPWMQWVGELQALLDKAVADGEVNGRKLQKRFYQPWLDALLVWANDPLQVMPLKSDSTGWIRLTPEGLTEVWKDKPAPAHPALEAMSSLRQQLLQLPEARSDILRHAARWVCERFALEKQRRAEMGFNDLLTQLDAALQGDNGERLAEVIRNQFPVALIDEFQDTDPLQYRIFDAIYQVSSNAAERALILIGDPKQAIYAFRGADIFTYLQARRDTEGRHYTLGTNFRSTRAMVSAVNHVFGYAEAHPQGQGAFLFRAEGSNPVPFLPVEAKGRGEHFMLDGQVVRALTCWTLEDEKPIKKGAYGEQMAAATAAQIIYLLRQGQAGKAGFSDNSGVLRPVQPGDIAVLVNTGTEAALVRQALSAGGVRSVYLSDKESVFQSAAATEVQFWLNACAEPDDERRLRAALGTPTLDLSWAMLDELNHNETAWEARVQQFREYRELWRRQGVLPMLRRLLNAFQVPRRLLASGNERALTDILHLAELLQQQSLIVDGEHALIRYLAEQRVQADGDADARKLRLESDDALVKVVTVHKSKGLEYPLVFLPYACAFRQSKATDLPLKWHDDSGRLLLSLEANDERVAQVDRERLGEDLRKYYVALTRARYVTWVGMASLDNLQLSAPGYLLNGGDPIASDELFSALTTLASECADIAVEPLPDGVVALYQSETASLQLAEPLPLPARPEQWWISSYSGLEYSTAHGMMEALPVLDDSISSGPETARQDTFTEAVRVEMQEEPALPVAQGSLHAFPRGPKPGSFLHALLEWAADEGFAQAVSNPQELRDMLARRCQLRGWQEWIEPLCQWLPQLLQTAFHLDSAPLAAFGPGSDEAREPPHVVAAGQHDFGQLGLFDEPVPEIAGPDALAVSSGALSGSESGEPLQLTRLQQYQKELEFWFAIDHTRTGQLDRLVCQHTLGGVARPALSHKELNGMLKGFIDLVFEHQGRYYVADYKSNWLGADDSAYSKAAMQQAILEHRYDLQYALYLFALHRLLKARLPDYDYDQHVGGAVYLFLRGSQAPSQGLHFERPGRELIDGLEALFSPPSARASTAAEEVMV
ncbi:exodeoxyribonuclease V subunit beta [Pokkaliibacter plantistimulans]|uniref:exodeoxyribonuclease V subunit beta n=1 Tax=Pokkaliibacter plantistimulans TaxID=1635171 RepID=UPI002694D3FA|nr:exodeoxyribonuclease V subunit beta [Pokkaliibacter plantistimulans]